MIPSVSRREKNTSQNPKHVSELKTHPRIIKLFPETNLDSRKCFGTTGHRSTVSDLHARVPNYASFCIFFLVTVLILSLKLRHKLALIFRIKLTSLYGLKGNFVFQLLRPNVCSYFTAAGNKSCLPSYVPVFNYRIP